MTLRKLTIATLLTCLLAAVAVAALFSWRRIATEKRVTLAITQARSFLDKKDPDSAWLVIRSTRTPDKKSKHATEWYDLLVELAIQTHQLDRLERLRQQNTARFSSNPEAINWLQRMKLEEEGKLDPTLPSTATTVLFKADELGLQGHPEKAIALLKATKLQGKDEVERLLRLAHYNTQDLNLAREYLGQAYTIEPNNADLSTFIANVLETDRDIQDARDEYVAALSLAPENPKMRDNLAEFYIRQGTPALAIGTWKQAPATEQNRIFPLKAWFWERMTAFQKPSYRLDKEKDKKEAEPTTLLEKLQSIPKGQFWDDELEALYLKGTSLPERGEIFWLRFLSMLQSGKDKDAWDFLSGAPPGLTSSTPLLKEELQSILGVRTGTLTKGTLAMSEEQKKSSTFLHWLGTNQDNRKVLLADWVLPVVFAENHWPEASMELLKSKSLTDAPDWAFLTLARAAQSAGNEEAAGRIASMASSSPLTQILQAEAALKNHQTQEGREILEKKLSDPEVGFRAALLLSLSYLESGRIADVERVLASRPDFANSVVGKEIRARLYLRKGDELGAVMIYETIDKDSDDARIFLAHRAYATHDWSRAEELTRSLMKDHPEEPSFGANLEKIQAAQAHLGRSK